MEVYYIFVQPYFLLSKILTLQEDKISLFNVKI